MAGKVKKRTTKAATKARGNTKLKRGGVTVKRSSGGFSLTIPKAMAASLSEAGKVKGIRATKAFAMKLIENAATSKN